MDRSHGVEASSIVESLSDDVSARNKSNVPLSRLTTNFKKNIERIGARYSVLCDFYLTYALSVNAVLLDSPIK
jgi:hypothetical protein